MAAIWRFASLPKMSGRARDLLAATLKQIEIHGGDLALCVSSKDVRAARAEKKIAVMLGIEGGHAIDNDLAVLREFHSRGVRYMTLTHNAATEWADSSNDAPRHNGLTDFGNVWVRRAAGWEPLGTGDGASIATRLFSATAVV